MKISSQLFFRAIIVEYLEDLGFSLKETPILYYIYELGNVKVKVVNRAIHVYDMSQKADMDKLKVSVRYNETRSLDKVRDAVNELLNKELCLARVE